MTGLWVEAQAREKEVMREVLADSSKYNNAKNC